MLAYSSIMLIHEVWIFGVAVVSFYDRFRAECFVRDWGGSIRGRWIDDAEENTTSWE